MRRGVAFVDASLLLLGLANLLVPIASVEMVPPARADAAALAACAVRADAGCQPTYNHRRPMSGSMRVAYLKKSFEAYSNRCISPVVTAWRLTNNSLVPPTPLPSLPVPRSFAGDGTPRGITEWRYVPSVLERALRRSGGAGSADQPVGCLVYAFGVQRADEFSDFYAGQGCSVFAFDPTVNHPREWRPNITFYPWGLASSDDASRERMDVPSYGKVTGSLYTFGQILAMLGHDRPSVTIAAVKLDCEGCEYAALRDLYCLGRAAPRILSFSIEFHMRVEQRLVTPSDVERIRYAGLFLRHRAHPYATFQFGTHVGMLAGYRGSPAFVYPELVAAGVPWLSPCCYMYGFVLRALES